MQGDLTPLFAVNFDTRIGHKREVESYRRITAELVRSTSMRLMTGSA